MGEVVWDMGTKTALVLLLMYGVLLLIKRFSGQKLSRRPGARIELLSTAALGPGRSVHLLTAGGKVLLIGATGQQVSLLAELDPTAVEADEAEVVSEPWSASIPGVVTGFSESLSRAWQLRGDAETRRRGDAETRRHGDAESGGRG